MHFPAFNKNCENLSCVDLMLTNHRKGFQNFCAIEIGFSHFCKMTVTVAKAIKQFPKLRSRILRCRNYLNLFKII